ncbi:DMT family transporter [Caenispirillum salinarum]|uniref:DMT family transporter n=1 Tax=Caenispirillum salinarum TaxID=859058 RepID=UPI00384DDC4A
MRQSPAAAPAAPSPAGAESSARHVLVGSLWGIGAALIWAGWMAITRLGVTTTLTAADLTVLRFGVAGLILAPVLWRARHRVTALPWPLLAGMVIGAGAPYSMVLGFGLTMAPAAHAGALVPGTLPLFTALLSALFLGEVIARRARLGLVLIVAGALTIGGLGILTGWPQETAGHAVFLCGAVMWATFTVCMRRAALPPLEAVAVVCVASGVLFTPLYLALPPQGIPTAPVWEVLMQAFYQGVMSAVAALFCFSRAVAMLGAARAAVFGALVPVLVSLLGIPVLGEWPTPGDMAGIVAVSLGVFLASGARLPGRRRRPPP